MIRATVRGLLNRLRIYRLERRGDVVTGWSKSLVFSRRLPEELIREKNHKIPRDLFGLLAYTWLAQAGVPYEAGFTAAERLPLQLRRGFSRGG